MKTALVLSCVIAVTMAGDYLIKLASQKDDGLSSPSFILGAVLYGLPALGWFFLMRSHSLSAIGVLYSAATILILAGLGVFAFGEPFGLREALGISLAIAAVVVISH